MNLQIVAALQALLDLTVAPESQIAEAIEAALRSAVTTPYNADQNNVWNQEAAMVNGRTAFVKRLERVL